MWLDVAAGALIVAQIVIPLAVGLRELRSNDRRKARSAEATPTNEAAAPTAPLVPLRCAACGGPVPLLAASFPCPYCEAPIAAPEEYRRTLLQREQAIRELEVAERIWRRSRFVSSRVVTILARLSLFVVFGAVIAAAFRVGDAWPHAVLAFAILTSLFQLALFQPLISVFADLRTALPAVPKAKFRNPPEEMAACTGCSAPVRFDQGKFATTCAYCGTDSYRQALAHEAWTEARRVRAQAGSSLREAIQAWRMRREEAGGPLAILAAGQLLLLFAGAIGGLVSLFE